MANRELPSPNGRRLGIIEKLGGTASDVYKLRDNTNGEVLLGKRWDISRGFTRSCWRELYVWQQLQAFQHQTKLFVTLYEWFTQGEQVWLIGEFSTGFTLQQLVPKLNEIPFPPQAFFWCAFELFHGMVLAVESLQFSHGDIRPTANIVFEFHRSSPKIHVKDREYGFQGLVLRPRLYDFDKSSVKELPDGTGSDDVSAVREILKTLFITMSPYCPALLKQEKMVLKFVHELLAFDENILDYDIFDTVRKY